MNRSQTITITAEFDKLSQDVRIAAKSSVGEDGVVLQAIDKVLEWFQGDLKVFLTEKLSHTPLIKKYADKISTSVVSFIFAVIRSIIKSLEVLFTSLEFWKKAHKASMVAWNQNESNGLLSQGYAYSKKMAGFLLEVFKQCFERAIKANGLEMSVDEKFEISMMLDEFKL